MQKRTYEARSTMLVVLKQHTSRKCGWEVDKRDTVALYGVRPTGDLRGEALHMIRGTYMLSKFRLIS